MKQLLYVSSKAAGRSISLGNILMVSRRNNDAAGVTGLLYTDGTRFLQVLEGDDPAVDLTFARIKADLRHQALVVLSDKQVERREFGGWAMAHRHPTESVDTMGVKLMRMLAGASPSVRQTFLGLVAARATA